MHPELHYYYQKSTKFRGPFNAFCGLVFLLLFYAHKNFSMTLFNRNSNAPTMNLDTQKKGKGFQLFHVIHHRKMAQINTIYNMDYDDSTSKNLTITNDPNACNGLFSHEDKCQFLMENTSCTSGGYFNYLAFLYCNCKSFNFLGYAVLLVWLVALFYLLGNTAADYFCCSIEKLCSILRMPPTVAGVTLLPLGNGAPDLFSSIAAFMGKGDGDVGLNSVLGGAVFVTCIVVGTISIFISNRKVQIDKNCFVRDIFFFLFAILSLGIILIDGVVFVSRVVPFILVYVVYSFVVVANEVQRKNAEKLELDERENSIISCISEEGVDDSIMGYSMLYYFLSNTEVPHLQCKVSQLMWPPNVSFFSSHTKKYGQEGPNFVWGWIDEETEEVPSHYYSCFRPLLLLDVPLTIPRRLTIPIVEEERWSKGYAVASAFFSPLLLAFLWINQDNGVANLSTEIVCFACVTSSCVLGILAYLYTSSDHPPQRFLFPWVLGGFLMSIVWFYIIASELVSLLLAFVIIFGINPSILGLTVLAWGNSTGDLVLNVAMAMNSKDGVQIAVSGCYASPMFNVLVGLGISLLLGSWSRRPEPFIVPRDGSLFYTMGFLCLALIWSLVMLPRINMCPNKAMGIGLIVIYTLFLSFRVCSYFM